jgi:hypothetical protein
MASTATAHATAHTSAPAAARAMAQTPGGIQRNRRATRPLTAALSLTSTACQFTLGTTADAARTNVREVWTRTIAAPHSRHPPR